MFEGENTILYTEMEMELPLNPTLEWRAFGPEVWRSAVKFTSCLLRRDQSTPMGSPDFKLSLVRMLKLMMFMFIVKRAPSAFLIDLVSN